MPRTAAGKARRAALLATRAMDAGDGGGWPQAGMIVQGEAGDVVAEDGW